MRRGNPLLWVAAVLGIAFTVAGVAALVAAALLVAPLLVWLAWNVLDLGAGIGLGDFGFWGIVLLALFLASGWLVRMVVVALVFLIEPSWSQGSAELRLPEPSLRHFLALAILLAVAGLGHSGAHRDKGGAHRDKGGAHRDKGGD